MSAASRRLSPPGDENAVLARRRLATRKNEPTVETGQRKQRCCFPPSEYFRKTQAGGQGKEITAVQTHTTIGTNPPVTL